jgi:8-oxo-dGTP pyrophosphatase MutT (NUDIX family)
MPRGYPYACDVNHDRYTDRVLAYVTRERDGRLELLVFEHRDYPDAGVQVPAGRLEAGEDLEAGLLRELEEEAGLSAARVVRKLGTYQPGELPSGGAYRNHAYEVAAPAAPDGWEHTVVGRGDDAGLVFRYRWAPMTRALRLWLADDPVLEELA